MQLQTSNNDHPRPDAWPLMRALVQRVSQAAVSVDEQVIGQIDQGVLILICAMQGDGPADVTKLARKITNLRIFPDETGKMNLSLMNIAGAALVVSQFTLAADTSRGNRPGFSAAADPQLGRELYDAFITDMANNSVPVETGKFGADMAVSLVNDGPVTIWLET